MATVQLPNPSEGRDYYDRKKASGKTSKEAMRCLKRRLSGVVNRHMVNDAVRLMTGPEGYPGATAKCSATGSHLDTGSSNKSKPGPASAKPKTDLPAAS